MPLEDEHTEWKEFALACLSRIESYPLERVSVESLLDNPIEGLGGNAMVYLSRAYPEEAVEILRAGLQHTNPTMRGHACTEAGFRDIRELKEAVNNLSKDTDDYVSRSVQIAMDVFVIAEMQ